MNLLKWGNLGKKIILSNFNLLKLPYKLTFAVTYKCNSRCITCNIWRKKTDNELTLGEIDTFFKDNSYFSWIDITGGEIFLRPDIVDIFKSITTHCKNLHTLHFPTNGLLTDKIISSMNDIRKLPIHKLIITVSIDGPPEIHNKIRGLPNSFERAVNTLNELRKMKGIIVFAGMTLSKDNVLYSSDTIAKLKEKVPGFQINDLHVNIAHSSSHFYGIELSDYPKEKVLSVLKEFRPTRGFNIFHPISWLEKKYQTKIREYFKTGNCPMPCHSMAASCFLDPYGNVYPCSIYNKVIGNVRDERFEDIWLKKERRALASEIRNLNCPQCWTPCEAYQTILANLFRFCAKK